MNVLVVGGTGFVGTNLCRELVERGHDVTALSRSPGDADLPESVERVSGDVTAYDSIEGAFEGQDAVIYLTALSPLFKPKGGYDRHYEVHLGGTENCVRAAEAHGVDKYVQMSALGAEPDADTAYIRSKGQAEGVVRDSSLDWTIVRPSILFGDGCEFVKFTKLLAPPYFTPLPGGGKTPFQPIWIGDFAPVMVDIVEGRVPEAEEEADEAAVEDTDGTDGADADGAETGDAAAETDGGEEGPGDEADDDAGDSAGDDEEAGDGEEEPEITRVDAGAAGAETDPHVGETYEFGGPEVLTLAELARLVHAADNKPTNVYSIPMPLVGVGLRLVDPVPGFPFGSDQYRSLKVDNSVPDEANAFEVFGVDHRELTTFADHYGVDPEAARTGRPTA